MNVFNSLGSNYSFTFAIKSLLAKSDTKSTQKLKHLLASKYQGKVHLTYKGREALYLALKALKLPGDSSIAITGFTCYAVYQAVTSAGLKVEYVDIDKSLNFSPHIVLKSLNNNSKIRAVIVQNTLGFPANAEKIKKICEKHNIFLIEDLAHSVGTKYSSSQEAGKVGDATVFSFSQDKLIDAVSGGAVVIRNKKLQDFRPEKFKHPSNFSQRRDQFYPLFTFFIRSTYGIFIGKIIHRLLKLVNFLSMPMVKSKKLIVSKLPGRHCKLVLEGLNDLEANLTHRKKIAQIYSKTLDSNILSQQITTTINKSANIRFPIFVKNRTNLIEALRKSDVYVSDIWYDAPISPKRYLKDTSYIDQCPKAENLSAEILNLPTHRNVSVEKAQKISKLINQWLTHDK